MTLQDGNAGKAEGPGLVARQAGLPCHHYKGVAQLTGAAIATCILHGFRSQHSSPAAMVDTASGGLAVQIKQGVAIVSLNKEPVNTLDLDMWAALAATLEQLEANRDVRGAIFLSGVKRDVFTAGAELQRLSPLCTFCSPTPFSLGVQV
jgi:hypothetical protein